MGQGGAANYINSNNNSFYGGKKMDDPKSANFRNTQLLKILKHQFQ